MRDVTGEGPGAASFWSLTAWAVMSLQGSRHSAAKYPNDRNKGRASDNCEDQSGELEIPNILTKSSWAASNNMLALYCSPRVNFATLNR